MALSSCLIFMILVGVAFSVDEVFIPTVSGIFRDGVMLVSWSTGEGSLCYNGRSIFFTSEQLEIGTYVPGNTATEVHTSFAAGYVIHNVDCCCNILAYGYMENTTSAGPTYHAHAEFLETNVEVDFSIANAAGINLLLSVNCHTGYLHVISQTTVRTYNLNDPTAAASEVTIAPSALSFSSPKCAASYIDAGNNEFLFISGPVVGDVAILNMTSGMTIIRQFTYGGSLLLVFCITIDGSKLFVIGQTSAPVNGNFFTQNVIFSVNVDDVLSSTSVSIVVGSVLYLENGHFTRENLNGISVCTNCNDGCQDLNCTASTCEAPCGYCSPNTAGSCVCETSAPAECIYNNATYNEECIGPQIVADTSCIVQYPLAERSRGPEVTVLGHSRQHAAVTVDRLAKTGRWPTSALPNPRTSISDSNAATTGTKYYGFSAAVPVRARGRRFGMFYADFEQTDQLYRNEIIPCLSTENSGFYNKYYTYTRNSGENVVLEAAFSINNTKFIPELVWKFTRPGTSPAVSVLPACKARLTCPLTGVTSDNEGVYEVYRFRRYLRLWHPFFYLHVRDCGAGVCGELCDKSCPSCEQGVCDVRSCSCVCHPGWTGTLCDSPCPAGKIGQECGITCVDHFDSPDCKDLLICRPGKAGCSCYSGLQSPECNAVCDTGTWGPNCRNACTGGSCDARTGPP